MLSAAVTRMADVAPLVGRDVDALHHAASTMKVPVLAAVHRSADPDARVRVVNRFQSVVGGTYENSPDRDSDPQPWQYLGREVSLRWLAERMVTRSSNLATNLCLAAVGRDAVADVWRKAEAAASVTARGIGDYAAESAGVSNLVSVADLVRLLRSLEPELLRLLERNVHRADIPAGLPTGTRVAFKNGWFPGLRHSAGVVYPDDAAPYVFAVCYSGALASGHAADDPAARLVSRLSARCWRHRREPLGPRWWAPDDERR